MPPAHAVTISTLLHQQQAALDQLRAMSDRVDALAHTLGRQNGHTGAATLLVGWDEIGRFARKRPTTLQGYRRSMSFPAIRWGRHVVSSPALIEGWLLTIETRRRQRKAAQAAS